MDTCETRRHAILRRSDFERRGAGKRGVIAGAVHDITERKRAEETQRRLVTAVEQAVETIVITDPAGAILYANPAFEKTTGYTCAEALGQNPSILKSDKHDAGFYRDMWMTLAAGQVWRGRFINKRKDGTLYEEEATISPVRNTTGKIVNYVAVKRDIRARSRWRNNFDRPRRWSRSDAWRVAWPTTSTTC